MAKGSPVGNEKKAEGCKLHDKSRLIESQLKGLIQNADESA